jgi:hypothetical protein
VLGCRTPAGEDRIGSLHKPWDGLGHAWGARTPDTQQLWRCLGAACAPTVSTIHLVLQWNSLIPPAVSGPCASVARRLEPTRPTICGGSAAPRVAHGGPAAGSGGHGRSPPRCGGRRLPVRTGGVGSLDVGFVLDGARLGGGLVGECAHWCRSATHLDRPIIRAGPTAFPRHR